ncbi:MULTISPECIES: hypothetical protein [Streptomyces]|uniref:Secreted protein n=1 Tax=Streptomyces dengpaensis TaxID=2049881 RepID=A0ABM6SRR4_9ACTN|nr:MULTISPECIES: hypothetical protein [Streptomyces]AVH57398.1 hypothetical protein C4B68_18260 [Streptomyces dengpaensis]PIA98539.1 hypothetical protein B1C81_39625 [Streptomyces sp. HG99]
MKKHLAVLISGGALAVSVLGLQGEAMAASTVGDISVKAHPSGCTYSKYNPDGHQGAIANCSKSNGGHYKAIVVCKRYLDGSKVTRESATWKSSGDSIVWCPPETFSVSAGVMTKAS